MINSHTIYRALTKPSLIMGLPASLAVVLLLASICFFVITGSFRAYLLYIPLHIACWLLCKIDSHIFSIIAKAYIDIPRTANQDIFGANAYDNF